LPCTDQYTLTYNYLVYQNFKLQPYVIKIVSDTTHFSLKR